MSPGAHLLFSWYSGATLLKNTRERRLVALAGIAPDIDGVGIFVDKITGTTNYFLQYHHVVGHSLVFAVLFSMMAFGLARTQRLLTLGLAFLAFHLHILCDLIGSRGSSGYQWPIHYLYGINNDLVWTVNWQWELNAWPNLLVMAVLVGLIIPVARLKRASFLEIFSARLDREAFTLFKRYI